MKTLTHVVFGFGAAISVMSFLGGSLEESLFISVLAAGMHPIIDRYSHARGRRGVYRTRLLHSFETLIPLALAAGFLVGSGMGTAQAIRASLAFAASAASHLALDMLTPGGVFLAGRRVRYPVFRWDDPLANTGFSAIGVLLSVAAVASMI